MATYQAKSFQLYNADGTPFGTANDNDRLLDDGDGAGVGDFTFNPPEAVSEVGGTNLSFEGVHSATVGGIATTVPVFTIAAGLGPDTYVIYSPADAADTVFPANALAGGFEDEDFTTCFLRGTQIDTPNGPRAVEALEIGDLVMTAEGASVPVKFVSRQTVFTMFRPAERVRLVRVAAGALGEGMPRRDLTLTGDHAFFLDGSLINASALVNGTTIDWVPGGRLGAEYTVYHVETESHEVILAEGAPAETYIDYVSRRVFDNYADYVALYGEETAIVEQTVPRISSARMLPPHLARRFGLNSAA